MRGRRVAGVLRPSDVHSCRGLFTEVCGRGCYYQFLLAQSNILDACLELRLENSSYVWIESSDRFQPSASITPHTLRSYSNCYLPLLFPLLIVITQAETSLAYHQPKRWPTCGVSRNRRSTGALKAPASPSATRGLETLIWTSTYTEQSGMAWISQLKGSPFGHPLSKAVLLVM